MRGHRWLGVVLTVFTTSTALSGCALRPHTRNDDGTLGVAPRGTIEPPVADLGASAGNGSSAAPMQNDAWETWVARQGFEPTEPVPQGDGSGGGDRGPGPAGEPATDWGQPEFNDGQPAAGRPASEQPPGLRGAPPRPGPAQAFRDDPFGTAPVQPGTITWRPDPTDPRAPASDARTPPAANRASAEAATSATDHTDPGTESPDPSGPVAHRGAEPLDVLLVDLQRELFTRSTYSTQPMRELLVMAALAAIDDDIELTEEHLRDLTETERDKVLAFNEAFRKIGARLADEAGDDAEAVLADVVESLHVRLIDRPALQVPTTALCWRVERFGDYRAFAPYRFLAGKGQEVIVYLEIANFTSVRNDRDEWITELSQQIRIYDDATATIVWEDPWQTITDRSSRQRNDFFTTQRLRLPRTLSVGRYNFKVQLRDENSGAETEQSLLFEVVADPKLAAKME